MHAFLSILNVNRFALACHYIIAVETRPVSTKHLDVNKVICKSIFTHIQEIDQKQTRSQKHTDTHMHTLTYLYCNLHMTPVGFEPTQLALVELESIPLDHSGKVSLMLSLVLKVHKKMQMIEVDLCLSISK